ncbi:MAG: hypothetical protein II951_12165 [Bacteroidales bacterium]|nr:hypothetical protein [Bacteroidales bacterium]
MKKFNIFLSLAALLFGAAACEEDPEGTLAGSDSTPVITVYQYDINGDTDANGNPIDADSNTKLRLAANSSVQSAIVFYEPVADYENRIKGGKEAYAEYAAANGSQVSVTPGAAVDTYVALPLGEQMVTVVAVGNGAKTCQSVSFTSVTWTDVRTDHFFNAYLGYDGQYTLQRNDMNGDQYRIKGLFGARSLVFNINRGADGEPVRFSSGTFITVPKQQTNKSSKDYGAISVAGVEDNCALFDDYSVYMVWDVTVSAGSFGQKEATFAMDEE